MNDSQNYLIVNQMEPKIDLVIIPELDPFRIQPTDLEEIFNLNQKRQKCDELDYLKMKDGLEWLYQGLITSKENGISRDTVQRIKVYGSNKRIVRPPKSYLSLLFEALQDFTMKILTVAALLSIGIEVGTADPNRRSTAWIEGFAILIAVVVCTNVAALNDYSKERQFQTLNKVSDKEKMLTVIRENESLRIHEQEVLTGDIVKLIEGMEIPADGVLIEASDVVIDESSMTGETHSIKKGTIQQCLKAKEQIEGERNGREFGEQERFLIPSPALLSGTRVLEGEGLFMVCVVGDNSCLGKIRASLEQEDVELTPLQEKLTEIAEDIGKLGLAAAILIVFVLLLRFAIERGIAGTWDNKYWGEIVQFFITGIVVLAVAIPEGLPLAVTLSLAFSVSKMMKDKNLVRKMYACETMGGADSICSDKTGTLTMNKMFLTKVWSNKFIEIEPHAKQQRLNQIMKMEELFLQSICCNSSAELVPVQTGSKTEISLLEYIQKTGVDYQNFRKTNPVIQKMPFNSSRKRMSVIIGIECGVRRLLTKGAPEYIIGCLSHFHLPNDTIVPITPELRDSIDMSINSIASQGLRTLCLAYRDLDGSEDLNKIEGKIYQVESEKLIFLCIVGIMDTLRQGVKEAVQECREAGIIVRMVTGDNKQTARAIAIQSGIIQEEDGQGVLMEGPEFVSQIGGIVCKNCKTERCTCARSSKDAEQRKVPLRVDVVGRIDIFKQLYPKLLVMARSRPQDKYALVIGLKELGHVVAVTGDGTNDAPALKKADVGFAMGISGTQVAKDAAAIVLMEDNFTDIVKAVMWGRNIYACIRKFLQFQLTVNIVAVGLTLITAAVLKQDVLRPIQMLWVNLIMDSFASLALATEPPNPILLKDKPYGRNEYIVTRKMFKHILGQSAYQMSIILIFVFTLEKWMPEYYDSFDEQSGFQQYYKYNMDYYPNKIISNGRFRSTDGSTLEYETIYNETEVPSRHFTIIFNLFVMLQVFNFFNARKLNDEINVFENITNNFFFIAILLLIIILQIIIVTFGGIAFQCYTYNGLQFVHWLVCIIFGAIGLLVSVVLKQIPEDRLFPAKQQLIEEDKVEEDQQEIIVKQQSVKVLELRRGSKKLSKKLSMGIGTDRDNQSARVNASGRINRMNGGHGVQEVRYQTSQ